MKCPKDDCRGNLSDVSKASMVYNCDTCDFAIGKERFNEVVSSLYKQTPEYKIPAQSDTALSELNNLGREKVTEDYSDSPHLNY